MAYDEDLADRLRAAIPHPDGGTEKRMFGGLAFLVHGNMAVSASGQGGILLRVDPTATDSLVSEEGVTRFEMRGREMNGGRRVPPSAAGPAEQLERWVEIGVPSARPLPPK